MVADRSPVLGTKHCADVLRYWSALLRYQEALSARPRARPNAQREAALNLLEPVAGQDYMKVPFAGAESFLALRKGSVELELQDERGAFFEDWLAMRYRPSDDGEGQVSQLVLFPVVHLPRGELAGVLRFPAEVTWLAGEKPFVVPSAAERGQRKLPEVPTRLRLSQTGKDPEQTLPFFVDTRLLRETLYVGAEELDEFFAKLRESKEVGAGEMVLRLCRLLEGAAEAAAGAVALAGAEAEAGGAAAADLLGRLRRAVEARLLGARSRSRVYPVALVVNGERARATWHVQRDIGIAIEELSVSEVASEAPLRAYLSGAAAAQGGQVCVGRWPHAPLTQSQRSALELGLGSSFCAIQGPPGSGKTTLILNGVVHQLIEKARSLAEHGVMGDDILIVTSTNNRAVDNVIDALRSDDLADNPLALRLGSREVTEQVTPRALERTLSWLSRQPATPPEGELARAKKEFLTRWIEVHSLTELARNAFGAKAELRRLRGRGAAVSDKGGTESAASVEQNAQEALGAANARLRTALEALKGGPAAAQSVSPEPEAPAPKPNEDVASQEPAAVLPAWQRAPGKAEQGLRELISALERLSEQCESDDPGAPKRIAASFARICRTKLPKAGSALGVAIHLDLPARGSEAPAPATAAATELWEDAIERQLGLLRDVRSALADLIRAPAREAERAVHDERIAKLEVLLREADVALDAEDTPAQREAHLALYRAALELRAAWMRENRAALEKAIQHAIAQCRRTRSLKSLFDAPRGPGLWLRQLFPCFGCTLLSLGNNFAADSASSARVIIDEAGQCHPAYAVSALMRAPHALVLGDVNQLEPVVGLGRDDENRIRRGLKLPISETLLEPYRTYDESGTSAQSLADRAVPSRPTLRDHFRCQREIIALCEAWCHYGMLVRTPARSRAVIAPELQAPVLFVPIEGEQQSVAGSWVNTAEADELQRWVQQLLARGIAPGDIGVITPFRSQAEALQRALRAARVPIESAREDESDDNLSLFAPATRGGLALGTVHRFQGGERSVMLFSTTVTRVGSLRFLDERVNLLNVAASRAKEHLVVIGHEGTLVAGRNSRVLVQGAQR